MDVLRSRDRQKTGRQSGTIGLRESELLQQLGFSLSYRMRIREKIARNLLIRNIGSFGVWQ